MNMKTKQFISKNFIFVLAVLLFMAFTGCKKTNEVKFDSAGGYWMEQLMILMLKLHLVLH